MVEINKSQEFKLLKFVLLVSMITKALEWVMLIGVDHKIVRLVSLDLDLLVVNLLRVREAQDLGPLPLLLLMP